LDYSKKKCIFIVKKLVLIDFPALEAAGYYVIWGILGAGNKRKLICNSPNAERYEYSLKVQFHQEKCI
jgi:hypothetical protein